MKSNQMNTTKRTALCGVLAALALVMLYIGGLTVLDLTVIAACALITMVIVVEAGVKYAWIYAAATSTLAIILLPNKLYAIEYICFAAVYPVAKLYFERLGRVWAWIAKIAFLDVLLLICLILAQYVFALGEEYFSLNFVTMVLGTAFFIVYDFALTTCITFYLVKLRKKLGVKK